MAHEAPYHPGHSCDGETKIEAPGREHRGQGPPRRMESLMGLPRVLQFRVEFGLPGHYESKFITLREWIIFYLAVY